MVKEIQRRVISVFVWERNESQNHKPAGKDSRTFSSVPKRPFGILKWSLRILIAMLSKNHSAETLPSLNFLRIYTGFHYSDSDPGCFPPGSDPVGKMKNQLSDLVFRSIYCARDRKNSDKCSVRCYDCATIMREPVARSCNQNSDRHYSVAFVYTDR